MIRHLTVLALAVAPLLAAGCTPEPNLAARPDAAYQQLDKQLHEQGKKRLDLQEAPVKDVVAWLESNLGCEVKTTPAADKFIAQTNPRVTTRTGEFPAELAYDMVRFALESKGLTLEPVGNVLGKPKLTLDRSVLQDYTPPAQR